MPSLETPTLGAPSLVTPSLVTPSLVTPPLVSPQELPLFQLSHEVIELFKAHKEIYHQAANLVVGNLYEVFFENKQDILGINYRLKSESSMWEKIIRRKFYKSSGTPESILDAIPDIIGIMIECEFIHKEKRLFEVLAGFFTDKHMNGYFYNKLYETVFIDLDMIQPIRQKNGIELYKLDCFCMIDGVKVNFELQIKSLVNSFWSEVEHNIVYKNNSYLPNDDYVNEMMDSVRMNLLGLDKILSLISGRIDALNSFTVMKELELNESLATQLISDLLNEKMFASLGFTVDTKTIRELMVALLMGEVKNLDTEEAFYLYLNRFRNLLSQDIGFKDEITFAQEYLSESVFKNSLGTKMLQLMNSDFEWHCFFIVFFHIDDREWHDSFDRFLSEIEDFYLNDRLFARMRIHLPEDHLKVIMDDTKKSVAKALCKTTEQGIHKVSSYKKSRDELQGFLQYTLNCTGNINEWQDKKEAFSSVVNNIIANN